jgi:hypothetical protein
MMLNLCRCQSREFLFRPRAMYAIYGVTTDDAVVRISRPPGATYLESAVLAIGYLYLTVRSYAIGLLGGGHCIADSARLPRSPPCDPLTVESAIGTGWPHP